MLNESALMSEAVLTKTIEIRYKNDKRLIFMDFS